jgi:hypothetical protein
MGVKLALAQASAADLRYIPGTLSFHSPAHATGLLDME